MAKGGSRKHPAGCKCGKCPKIGRPKVNRPTNATAAGKVLAQAKAEKLWVQRVAPELKRLGLATQDHKHHLIWKKSWASYVCADCGYQPDANNNFSIIPLTNLLRYLEDRAYGRPMDTVNHLHDKPLEVNATLELGAG